MQRLCVLTRPRRIMSQPARRSTPDVAFSTAFNVGRSATLTVLLRLSCSPVLVHPPGADGERGSAECANHTQADANGWLAPQDVSTDRAAECGDAVRERIDPHQPLNPARRAACRKESPG